MKNIFIIIIVFFSIELFSQSHPIITKYTSRHFTTKDGLQQMQCGALFQDSKGFLWIGTKYGVARWDGRDFKIFSPKTGTIGFHFGIISEIDDGTIALLEAQNHISLINGDFIRNLEINFKNKKVDIRKVISFSKNEILIVAEILSENNTLDSYIINYNIESNKYKVLIIFPKSDIIYLNKNGQIITKNNGGNLYQYSDTTIITYYHWNKCIDTKNIFSELESNSENPSDSIPYLYNKKKSKLFYKISIFKEEIKIDTVNSPFENENIDHNAIFISSDSIWYFVDKQNNLIKSGKYKKEILGKVGVSNSIIEDREGNIWCAGENGLFCFYRMAIKEITFNISTEEFDNIWSMTGDGKGNFIYASYGSGFLFSNDNNHSWYKEKYTSLLEEKDPMLFKYATIGTVHTSKNGYILPHNKGVIYKKGSFYKLFPFEKSSYESFYTLEDTINNLIYISGYRDIYVLNENNLEFKNIKKFNPNINSTNMAFVFDYNNRLVRVGKTTPSYFEDGKWTDLPNCSINKSLSACKDYKGNLWISGLDSLFLYNYKSTIAINNVPFQQMILALTTYKKWLIIGGGNELVFMDLEEYYKSGKQVFQRYDAGSGLNILEGGQNSFYHDSDGSIYWCCADKVIQFFPDLLLKKNSIFPPSIHSIFLSNFSNQIDILGTNFDSINYLPKSYRNLNFSFSSAVFNNNSQLIYRHRLVGLDEHWSIPTSESIANFVNLSPGDYIFEVQASIDGINWSESAKSEIISIPYYFYEYPVFILFITLVVIFSISYSIINIYKRKRDKKIEEIQKQYQLNNLLLQNIRSKHIPHFSGNVFNNVDWLIESKQYEAASKYISIISKLFNKLLIDADKPSHSLQEEVEFVDNYLILEKLRFKEKLVYSIDNHYVAEIGSVQVPNLIIHTIVENSIKHGLMSKKGFGKIEIIIEKVNNNFVLIKVKDDGIGRDEAKLYNKSSTKKGIELIQNQIKMFNAKKKFHIEFLIIDLKNVDEKPVGTEVQILIPIHYNFSL
jgi:hypothetical protein